MSIRVTQASQLGETTTDWSCSCANFNLEGGGWYAEVILSTGHPYLQGVCTLFKYPRPSSSISVLLFVSCDRWMVRLLSSAIFCHFKLKNVLGSPSKTTSIFIVFNALFKLYFNQFYYTKIYEVINVEAHINGWMAKHDWAAEDAWEIFILFEANVKEGRPILFIPAVWDSLQPIHGSYDPEVSVWGDNGEILRGE